MTWLAYALIASAVYTGVAFVDKYLIEREVRDPRSLTLYAAITAALAGLILWAAAGFPLLPPLTTGLVLFTGMLAIWGVALYFQAIAQAHASTIIMLIQLVPLFVLILAWIFLGERLSPRQLAGFALILGAALAVSVQEEGSQQLTLSPALLAMLGASLLWAGQQVLFKAVSRGVPLRDLLGLESLGFGLGGALLTALPGVRRAFQASLRTVRWQAVVLVFVNEAVSVGAKLAMFAGIALGPVSLVAVVGGTQVFMGIGLGWALTALAPAVFHEDVRALSLARRGGLAALVLAGVWLVG